MKLFLEPNRQIHNDSETKRFTVHVHVSQKKKTKEDTRRRRENQGNKENIIRRSCYTQQTHIYIACGRTHASTTIIKLIIPYPSLDFRQCEAKSPLHKHDVF